MTAIARLLTLYLGYLSCVVLGIEHRAKPGDADRKWMNRMAGRFRRYVDGNDLPPLPMRSGSTQTQPQSGTRDLDFDGDAISTRFVFNTDNHEVTAEADSRRHTTSYGQDAGQNAGGYRIFPNQGSSSSSRTSRVYSTGSRSYPSGTSEGQTDGGQTVASSGTNQGTTQGGSLPDGYALGGGQNARAQFSGLGRVVTLNSRQSPTRGIISDYPTCQSGNHNVFINGMNCTHAVDTLGSFVCYNYERVSNECCRKCLALKRAYRAGCEYGDRSYQCRNMQPFDCYNRRNREICCETCDRLERQRAGSAAGCQYGDWTPRCQMVRNQPHLCYQPENKRLCCNTCPLLADRSNPECSWGDQNPDLCQLYSSDHTLRLNCYVPSVREVCCTSCARLASSYRRHNVTNCEYGDRPTAITTSSGILNCREYVANYGLEVCDRTDISIYCCYTCHQYQTLLHG